MKRLAELKLLEAVVQEPGQGPGQGLGLILESHSEGGQATNEGGHSSSGGGGGGGGSRGGGLVGRRSTVRFAPPGDGDDVSAIAKGQGLEHGQGHDDEASSGTSAAGGGSGGLNSVGGSVATRTVAEGVGSISGTKSAKVPGLRGILVNGGGNKRPNVGARLGLKFGKTTTATPTVTVNNTTRKLNLPPGGPPSFTDRNMTPPVAPLPFTANKTTTSATTKSSKRFNFGWVISAAKSAEPSIDSTCVDGADVETAEDAVWRIGHRRRLEARRAARKQVTTHTLSIV